MIRSSLCDDFETDLAEFTPFPGCLGEAAAVDFVDRLTKKDVWDRLFNDDALLATQREQATTFIVQFAVPRVQASHVSAI